jgi:ABC-2 type transport system permease protein
VFTLHIHIYGEQELKNLQQLDNNMNRYIRIYKACIKTSFARTVAYPGNFYSGIFSSLIFTGLHLVTILLLTSRVDSVFGWRREELIILTIVFNFQRALLETFFYGGLGQMAETIFKGELDGILLKPVNSQFIVSIKEMRFEAYIRIAVSLLLLWYFININHIHISFINVMWFFILSGFAIMLLYSLWYIFTTLLIWNPVLTNIKDLLAYTTGLLRYPPELFKEMGSVVFVIMMPFLFVVAPSTLALLGKLSSIQIMGIMIISLFFFYLSQAFWNFALRKYTSASS